MIYRPNQRTAGRAQDRVQVGREFSARSLRKLDRFFGHSNPRPPKRERGICEIANLIGSDASSDLDFGRAKNFFSFSLTRAWARALKNRANHLSLRTKSRAHAHARLGREIDAGLQKT
jgi:hypothetical protein